MLILLLGVMFLMIFVQVTLYHYRQNFRHWSMWLPVIATPINAVLLVSLAFYNLSWLRLSITIMLALSLVVGGMGSYLHLRGIGERVGGYAARNFLVGPPVMLPGLVTGSSLLGLLLLYWG